MRADRNLTVVASVVKAEARAFDRDLLVHVSPMTEVVGYCILPSKVASAVAGIVGGVGVLLASIGLYGVLAYVVGQRRREFGIRVALGASARDVVRLVLKEAAGLTLRGIGIGTASAAATSWLLAGVLYGVSPIDPATFVGVPLVLAIIALLAAWIPARHATRIDPSTALRAE